MGRGYAVPYNGTVTNAGGNADIFSHQPADDIAIRKWGILLSQISEVADAAEEGLRVTIKYLPATYTVGSGGNAVTALTPSSDPAGNVWGATVRTNDTTVGTTSGTALVRQEIGWNERNSPYDFFFPNELFAPVARQGAAIADVMETTPADDFTGCFTSWFEELS